MITRQWLTFLGHAVHEVEAVDNFKRHRAVGAWVSSSGSSTSYW